MSRYEKREITEEIYRRAVENRGYLAAGDAQKCFTDAELIGYGYLILKVQEIDGKYFINYIAYDSCD